MAIVGDLSVSPSSEQAERLWGNKCLDSRVKIKIEIMVFDYAFRSADLFAALCMLTKFIDKKISVSKHCSDTSLSVTTGSSHGWSVKLDCTFWAFYYFVMNVPGHTK